MKFRVILSATLVLGASCSTEKAFYIHTPDTVFNPGIKDSGDIRIAASAKLQAITRYGGSPVSASADAAWSPARDLAVFASYRGVNNRSAIHDRSTSSPGIGNIEEQSFALNGNAADIAIGYYRALGINARFEVYCGAGFGRFTNISNKADPGYYSISHNRFFAQSDLGFDYDILSFSAGFRLSAENVYSFRHDGNSYFSQADSNMYLSVVGRYTPYFDPYMELQLGGRHIRALMQLGFDASLIQHPYGILYRPSAAYITMGITYRLKPAILSPEKQAE